VIPRRLLSEPGEAAERSAQARAARGVPDKAPAHRSSPRQDHYLPPGTPAAIAAQAGYGRSLPPASTADFEARLGADLGHARVHDDAGAAALADAADARAFTLGSHVFFGAGEYQPDTRAGHALLAHELAHVADPPSQLRIMRQPKGEVTEGEIETVSVPADQFPAAGERFKRLPLVSNAMDDAAQQLAALTGYNQDNVYLGLSSRFFKVYNSRGDRVGRVDTKDSEKVTFAPGVYVNSPAGLVAITVSNIDPQRLGVEDHPSVIAQRPLTDEEKKAQEKERAQAAAEKRAPKPLPQLNVNILDMSKDRAALQSLLDTVPHSYVVYFVPSYERMASGGKGGGDQASRYASPIEGRADGQPANSPPWPVKVEGPKLVPVDADPTFEAKVDWSAHGNTSTASQVISQVGENIHYRWELFDITGYANEQAGKNEKIRPNDPAATPRKTVDERIKEFTESKRGTGTNVTGMGGANREFAREFEDWWSDTKRAARRTANPAGDTVAERLSHAQGSMLALEMTPASLLVTAVHAALRWLADLFAGPRKQQEVPLREKGIFLVRVITTPAVNEDRQGNPVIRPPSVDAKVVEVSEMDTAVKESLDEPEAQLAELRSQIALAREAAENATSQDEKKNLTAKADYLQNLFDEANQRFFGSPLALLQKRWDVKKAELDAFDRDYKNLSDFSKKQELDKIHDQIDAYERHEKQRIAGASGLPAAARVNASLISEVTGEQYPLLLAAGQMPMTDGRYRWMLSDVTSGDGKAYVGLGDRPSAAFKSALEQFGDEAVYGRGRIGARTAGLGLEDGAPKELFADSAPADWALAMKRIDDLVATLVALGLIVESAGTAAALVGAAVAAARLIQRWEAGNLKPDAATFSDLLSVLGGVGAAGELAAGLRVERFESTFTVMKSGAATEEQLARAGELLAGAKSLAEAAKVANEAIGSVGMVWGDLSVIDTMLTVNDQERKGQLTHAAARRARADAISSAIQNHGLVFLGLAIKSAKKNKAAKTSRPETAPHEAGPAEEHQATEAPAPARPAAGDREYTHGELREVLPADLRDMLKFGGVEGDTVVIDWTPDQHGLVGEITIKVGPETTPGMLRLHIETVRTMQKYQGFSGRIRRALAWIAEIIGVETLDPSDPAFQTKLEIDKLTVIVTEQMNAMAAMEPDAREAAEGKLDALRNQLEEHLAALDIGELTPTGGVAARGVPKRFQKRYNELRAELRQYRPGSKEHRDRRWEMYQLEGGTWEYPHWLNVYQANVRNAPRANKLVAAEQARLGWPESMVEVTIEMPRGADRRLDLANQALREGAEVKGYASGSVPLDTDNAAEAVRDALLVKRGWKMTWIFLDCEPSGPLQSELLGSGIIIEKRTSTAGSSQLEYRLFPLLPAKVRR
jgi:hypothetical protein